MEGQVISLLRRKIRVLGSQHGEMDGGKLGEIREMGVLGLKLVANYHSFC